jgi:hypothetical protein
MLLTIIIIIILFFICKIKEKDGFSNHDKWSPDLIHRFITYQQTTNTNAYQYNLEILQQQASPQEAEHLLQTGVWEWTDELQSLYLDKIKTNPIIKIEPQYALNHAMKIYNKTAALELLQWNTKEGEFLLYGGNPSSSSYITCSEKGMQQKKYTGAKNISNEDIPNYMPGFSFIKEPCNPCVAFNDIPDYSCPFKLNIKGDDTPSSIWSKLWNI